jgi:hypothetical protein
MAAEYHTMAELIREKNIELDTSDPVIRSGFTQVPNFILRDAELTLGAKLTYAMFLSYAWNNDYCFPGQERLATDMGIAERSVRTYLQELQHQGLLTIKRRGLGKTNIYKLHFTTKKASGGDKAA